MLNADGKHVTPRLIAKTLHEQGTLLGMAALAGVVAGFKPAHLILENAPAYSKIPCLWQRQVPIEGSITDGCKYRGR